MNNLYVKTILYAYPSLYSVTKQIDDIIEKKALASLSDFSPCVSQCERILVLSYQKDLLLWLRLKVKKVLAQLSEKEIDLLDYKYFRKRSKEYYRDFDFVPFLWSSKDLINSKPLSV